MGVEIIFLALLVSTASCDRNQEGFADTDNELTAEDVTRVDPNPFKIPSLADDANPGANLLLTPQDIDLADQCFPKPQCDPSAQFRTMDGGCNNLIFPVWGQAHTASTRIIQANYSDGISQSRKSRSGNKLPDARRLRKAMYQDMNKPASSSTLLFMQFGQVIAHDTELIKSKTSSNGSPLECCNSDGSTPEILPKGCLSIKDDPGASKKRCFSAPRAADTSDLGCQIKPVRQQIGVTSFLDCSLLYGSDNKTASSLRKFVNGKLRSQVGSNGKSFLPNVKNATQSCNVVKYNTVCYASGDERVNQHPIIATLSIFLMRYHNLLCDELRTINPSWNDERLYQEARRLLIALYQHITYNEFLPILIGADYARANNLRPLSQGFDNNYNQFLNPTTLTSFTGASFRSLHSTIPGYIDLVNEDRKTTKKLVLSEFFTRTDVVQRNDYFDGFIRGLITEHIQKQDKYFTEQVSEYLFRIPNKVEGFDLVSLDIERGRDLGVAPYNKFRQLCGLTEAKNFNDLADQISRENIDVIAKLYEHVDDVDYYAAGLFENSKPGAIVGHTFQCIIGEMFFRWKFGDRFYYEFGNQTGSFKTEQLQEIRKITMSLMLCMTSDIKSIQKNAFDVPSPKNPLVPCYSLPKLNMNAWKEE